jgi:FSR family fosmidomycin resistance protein-like MFS transporter
MRRGFLTVGPFSVIVVLGQEYLPNRIGTAAGITLGAAFGVGGACVALLGVLADRTGLTVVLAIVGLLPLLSLALSLALPRERREPAA